MMLLFPMMLLNMLLMILLMLMTVMLIILNQFNFPYKIAIETLPPTPLTKKEHDPQHWCPQILFPDDVTNYDAYPYSLYNFKNKKDNMTPNTYFPENDAPDAADDDAASPDSRIVDFSLKHQIFPKSMLNFFLCDSNWFRRCHQRCLPQRNRHLPPFTQH